jgi:hypothetical protein
MSKRNCPSCELSDDELLPILFLPGEEGWEYLRSKIKSLEGGMICVRCRYYPYVYDEARGGWHEWIFSDKGNDWKRILPDGDPIRRDI